MKEQQEELDILTPEEIESEVKKVINYQTNVGWLICIGVCVVLLILNHYKVISW